MPRVQDIQVGAGSEATAVRTAVTSDPPDSSGQLAEVRSGAQSDGSGSADLAEAVVLESTVPPATTAGTLRAVVFEGMRTGEFSVTDRGAALADEASPVFVSRLIAAVQEPVTLSPAFRRPGVHDSALGERVLPAVSEYLKELADAAMAVEMATTPDDRLPERVE